MIPQISQEKAIAPEKLRGIGNCYSTYLITFYYGPLIYMCLCSTIKFSLDFVEFVFLFSHNSSFQSKYLKNYWDVMERDICRLVLLDVNCWTAVTFELVSNRSTDHMYPASNCIQIIDWKKLSFFTFLFVEFLKMKIAQNWVLFSVKRIWKMSSEIKDQHETELKASIWV